MSSRCTAFTPRLYHYDYLIQIVHHAQSLSLKDSLKDFCFYSDLSISVVWFEKEGLYHFKKIALTTVLYCIVQNIL